jgi:hypothetical protein
VVADNWLLAADNCFLGCHPERRRRLAAGVEGPALLDLSSRAYMFCHPVYNEVGVVKAHCGGSALCALFLTFLIPQRLGF